MGSDTSKAEAHSLPCLSLLISLSFSFEGQRGMKLWDLLLMMFFLQLNPVNWEVVQSLIMKWATCSQRSCHHFLRGSLHRVGRSFDRMIWKDYINVDTLWQILFTLLFFLNLYLFLSASILLYIYLQSFVYYFCIFSIQIFLSRLFFTIAKISGLLSVYIYVSICLLRILLSLSCILPFKEIPNQHYGLFWWLTQQRNCLQCGRPGFDPWVGKIQWISE